jgi:hypothetical protein
MSPILNIIRVIMPFTNEIANALTISEDKMFKRLYKPCASTWLEAETKTIIDVIALTGLCWNVAYMSHSNGVKQGTLMGITLVIIAFALPNLFMEPFVNQICENDEDDEDTSDNCSHLMRFLTAVFFIFILIICEYITNKFIISLKLK